MPLWTKWTLRVPFTYSCEHFSTVHFVRAFVLAKKAGLGRFHQTPSFDVCWLSPVDSLDGVTTGDVPGSGSHQHFVHFIRWFRSVFVLKRNDSNVESLLFERSGCRPRYVRSVNDDKALLVPFYIVDATCCRQLDNEIVVTQVHRRTLLGMCYTFECVWITPHFALNVRGWWLW